jgi:hypothetical protein
MQRDLWVLEAEASAGLLSPNKIAKKMNISKD